VLRGRAFRQRFPWIGEGAVGGSLCMSDGHANPRLVSPAFARAARGLGAQVYERTPITAVAHDGVRFQVSAQPAQGDALHVSADWLLNTSGAWANHIAGAFG
ncbi:FAD-dependent oxidoreductase, partial [Salmonella enterica subsp. enterica serovar Typhimurium]